MVKRKITIKRRPIVKRKRTIIIKSKRRAQVQPHTTASTRPLLEEAELKRRMEDITRNMNSAEKEHLIKEIKSLTSKQLELIRSNNDLTNFVWDMSQEIKRQQQKQPWIISNPHQYDKPLYQHQKKEKMKEPENEEEQREAEEEQQREAEEEQQRAAEEQQHAAEEHQQYLYDQEQQRLVEEQRNQEFEEKQQKYFTRIDRSLYATLGGPGMHMTGDGLHNKKYNKLINPYGSSSPQITNTTLDPYKLSTLQYATKMSQL